MNETPWWVLAIDDDAAAEARALANSYRSVGQPRRQPGHADKNGIGHFYKNTRGEHGHGINTYDHKYELIPEGKIGTMPAMT